MKCHKCDQNKLSNEFPFFPLTKSCKHALLHCLECAVQSVQDMKKCSQCGIDVTEDNVTYKDYVEALEFLFPNQEDQEIYFDEMDVSEDVGNIYVTTMSGESLTLSYNRNKRIINLKKEVETELKTEHGKQRLFFQNKECENHKTLQDIKIPSNSTLHLIVVICAVPDGLDELIFHFCWGLRRGENIPDYLDVSVFPCSGAHNVGYIYYRERSLDYVPGIEHSGSADMSHNEGSQSVNINLKIIPKHIDNIVFTLSAWRSSSVSEYPYYRLNFYDLKDPDKQLCNDRVATSVKESRSIIMCSLIRKNDTWEVIAVKKGSDGFTRDYYPLKDTIESLIKRNYR